MHLSLRLFLPFGLEGGRFMAHRILVVDGEVEGLARIQAHLQPYGYAFTWALSAREALESVARDPPDIVIVDAGVSDRGSIELVNELRRGDQLRYLPIVFAIEKGEEKHKMWARRAGADDVVEKPIEPELLGVLVRQLLRLKAAREKLLVHGRELASIREAQRIFVEAFVHDFKNPIAVVHVNLAWLADHLGGEKPELIEALSDAQEGIGRLQRMVDDLLMVGMLDQSSLPLKREVIRVTDLIEEVIKSHEREAIARNVSLRFSFRENVAVVGDPAVLRRVVDNMVESSLRHTPSSGVIELSAHAGDSIEIAVSNTGRPLDAEEKAQLLDKSEPASGTHLIATGSLGLYFCKRAVEAHAGQLDVVESDQWPTSLVMRFPSTGT
jgi:signal transduction histidine kinase